jgi:hypothetical protein
VVTPPLAHKQATPLSVSTYPRKVSRNLDDAISGGHQRRSCHSPIWPKPFPRHSFSEHRT